MCQRPTLFSIGISKFDLSKSTVKNVIAIVTDSVLKVCCVEKYAESVAFFQFVDAWLKGEINGHPFIGRDIFNC